MTEQQSTFWGFVLPPGETVYLDYPDDSSLTITSACLPSIGPDAKISRVIATIKTIPFHIESDDDDRNDYANKNEDEEETIETLLCTLIPNEHEFQKLDVFFSPLNIVEIKNTGNNEVHLAGILSPVPDDFFPIDYEEEEEEEEEEEGK